MIPPLRLLVKIAVYIVLLSGICFLFQMLIAPKVRDNNAFVGATIDKEKRLSELKSPRLIFVGGSNLALGLDSKKVSDSLHLNIANMGVHAGLGLTFLLNETKAFIKKGDVIVLSIEYGLTLVGEKKLLMQLIDLNPNASQYIDGNLNDKLTLIDINWQRCLRSLFAKPNETVYKRDGFSKDGDMIAHLNLAQANHLMDMNALVFRNYTDEINAINQFISFAVNKEAKVYFAFPPYTESQYKRNKSVIEKYQTQYKTELSCPIINTPQTFIFPDSNFYDSGYHLDKNGREKRTQIMISLLKKGNYFNLN